MIPDDNVIPIFLDDDFDFWTMFSVLLDDALDLLDDVMMFCSDDDDVVSLRRSARRRSCRRGDDLLCSCASPAFADEHLLHRFSLCLRLKPRRPTEI